MKLKEVTKNWIQEFAGERIFQRGEDYYHSGMVYEMEYYPEASRIEAKVSGNYGSYEVSIFEEKQKLSCDCDCPYDGYPCKHVVAVLLNYTENKRDCNKKETQRNGFYISLQEKLREHSHDDLVKIIIKYSQQIPEFKRALMMLVEPEIMLDFFLKQIRSMRLDDFEDDYYSSDLETLREFKKILKLIDNAPPEIKFAISWEIADKILKFLNQYGVSDERWENLVNQAFGNLEKTLKTSLEINKKRQEIIEKLKKYYEWGNSGMCDEISDLIEVLGDLASRTNLKEIDS